MKSFLFNLGKRIKEHRNMCNYTQEGLAELLGVSTNSVNAWETGKCLIKKSNLNKLCKILKITEEDLFENNLDTDLINKDSYYYQIMKEVKLLSINQQKQILDIIKTFKQQ